jgi:hypothetical protein
MHSHKRHDEKNHGMRYYKQFHKWPSAYLIALACGVVCLYLAFVWEEPLDKIGILVCAVFALIASWILWKDREHYLDIDQDWIVNQGFKRWQIRKADVMRVEHGRKGWVDDHDPYIAVYACGRVYRVEDGFLVDDTRIKELVQALQKTPA